MKELVTFPVTAQTAEVGEAELKDIQLFKGRLSEIRAGDFVAVRSPRSGQLIEGRVREIDETKAEMIVQKASLPFI